jgi:hypothetical protein
VVSNWVVTMLCYARLRYTILFYARNGDDDDDDALTCTHAHDVHQRVDGHGSAPDISPNYTCMHNRHEKSQQDGWMNDIID